nr:MAG TPA: hypothetical protein [Caudoviricetes sp.]
MKNSGWLLRASPTSARFSIYIFLSMFNTYFCVIIRN